jgi:hypothetical protein
MTDNLRRTLLLGAGFSFDFGMPIASELTEVFLAPFNWWNTRTLGLAVARNDPYGPGRPINSKAIRDALQLVRAFRRAAGSNYEKLLAEIQEFGDLPGKTQSDRDSYHYVFGFLYELIHAILYAYQLDAHATLYKANRGYFSAIKNVLSSASPTWAFSLNHDLFLECLAIDEQIPISYGATSTIAFPTSNQQPTDTITFATSSREDLAAQGAGWLAGGVGFNCVRLHGGLAEYEYRDRTIICNPSLKWSRSDELVEEVRRIDSMAFFSGGRRVPSGRDRVVTGPDGTLDILVRTMLTGGRKYTKTTNPKTGEEKLLLFDEVLLTTDELLVIGYSFGDTHVNNRILNAMVRNPGLKVRSVDPKGRRCPPFLEQFDYNSRVTAAFCRAADWLHYMPSSTWNLAMSSDLREHEKVRLEIRQRVAASWLRSRLR